MDGRKQATEKMVVELNTDITAWSIQYIRIFLADLQRHDRVLPEPCRCLEQTKTKRL